MYKNLGFVVKTIIYIALIIIHGMDFLLVYKEKLMAELNRLRVKVNLLEVKNAKNEAKIRGE